RGLDDARRMCAVAAEAVGCGAEQVLVGSTGVIGRHLPMEKVEPGIRAAAGQLAPTAAAPDHAAPAIPPTDTPAKGAAPGPSVGGTEVRVTGVAKGAAMIGPNMATLLAFVFTDAAVAPDDLAALAARASDQTFNCVSVEGHTSTNDALLLFANGSGQRLHGD